jgi:heme/copper-type cytochrome/quinol oxidase subunit 3
VAAFVVSEAGFFLVLILAYVFFNLHAQPGPTAASTLDARKTGAFTACLLASSLTLHQAEKGLRAGSPSSFRGWLGATIALGTVFMVGQAREYAELFRGGMSVSSNLFATSFFTLTGFHGLHVTLGLVALGVVFGLALAGDFRKPAGSQERAPGTSAIEAIALYWHFVDVVWIVVFAVVYLRALS